MLTTTNNTRFSYLRRVMLLPLLLISISIFSVRVHAKEKIETKINDISEGIFQKKIDTTKPPPPPPPSLNELIRTTKGIVFVNGKEVNKTELAKTLKPNEVTNIKFFHGEDAINKFGNKGKYGAIEITKGKPNKENLQLANVKTDTSKLLKLSYPANESTQKESYDKVFTTTQVPASFPGGLPAWTKYLERNLNRNIPVNNGAPPGKYTVEISFIVDKEGGISNVKAETDPGYGTAEEAIRMIRKGPSWVPAVQNGKKVVYRHKQSITFQISEE